MTAEWVVLAEGGQLATQLPGLTRRSHDYQQMALVNQLQFSKPSAGAAYERFTDAGPLALLPYGDDFKLVWTCSKAEATARINMDCATFADQLQTIMGERLGNLTHMGEPATFPLRLQQLNRVYSGRVICIGNAAQTMHPVAAQGLNLGVRDAECLAALLGASVRLDEPALAARYAAARQVDAHAIVGFTHGLVMLFDHPLPWLQWGQSAGMALLGSVPAWRRAFTKQLVFGV
ncbi:FAD-dependent monooxygenase [Snodgrassella sp. CFCC 13594]|uniref:FAD-dependent monooxygenase n=1 Tax=Snodgrassella sp. CFCC 13594 TaxID=1775559 RepID=UPI000A6D6509|nr:FAD-dependent monooxygenase [Snodgrassella sp. CFCC 13594]